MQADDKRMNFLPRFLRPILVLSAAAVLLLAGCKNMFVPRQKVLVDAISAPDAAKPSGSSYRLVAKKSVVTGQQADLGVIAACLNAALINIGMFEAPPGVPSDLFIEIAYGMDTTGRVDPSTRESFLELSARGNHGRSLDSTRDEELWNVRVAIAGIAGRLEGAMPLLCSVAVSYAATDTRAETTVQILENSPTVAAVRASAIKILETKATNNANSSASASAAK